MEEIEARLKVIPGIVFNFSQVIQDNVEEAMSGVKGENSIKLFGNDLKTMEAKAVEVEAVMKGVRGVKDLGIFRLVGQPNLLIQVDREASARYGLRVSDVNAVVQAAVGGQGVTQVYEGERLFDLVVRFLPEVSTGCRDHRQYSGEYAGRCADSPETGGDDQNSDRRIHHLSENNERYIPIKFSVRDRDLESTVKEAQTKMAQAVSLPERYRLEWAGQYDQLTAEQKRLTMIVPVKSGDHPVSPLHDLQLSDERAAGVGHSAVCVDRRYFLARLHGTHFSISAAVGVISTLGVAILGGVLLISRIEDFRRHGLDLREAVLKGSGCCRCVPFSWPRSPRPSVASCSVGHRDRLAGTTTAGPGGGGWYADCGGVDPGCAAGLV